MSASMYLDTVENSVRIENLRQLKNYLQNLSVEQLSTDIAHVDNLESWVEQAWCFFKIAKESLVTSSEDEERIVSESDWEEEQESNCEDEEDYKERMAQPREYVVKENQVYFQVGYETHCLERSRMYIVLEEYPNYKQEQIDTFQELLNFLETLNDEQLDNRLEGLHTYDSYEGILFLGIALEDLYLVSSGLLLTEEEFEVECKEESESEEEFQNNIKNGVRAVKANQPFTYVKFDY